MSTQVRWISKNCCRLTPPRSLIRAHVRTVDIAFVAIPFSFSIVMMKMHLSFWFFCNLYKSLLVVAVASLFADVVAAAVSVVWVAMAFGQSRGHIQPRKL